MPRTKHAAHPDTMLFRSLVLAFSLGLASAGTCNDKSTDCGNWCAALPPKPPSPSALRLGRRREGCVARRGQAYPAARVGVTEAVAEAEAAAPAEAGP